MESIPTHTQSTASPEENTYRVRPYSLDRNARKRVVRIESATHIAFQCFQPLTPVMKQARADCVRSMNHGTGTPEDENIHHKAVTITKAALPANHQFFSARERIPPPVAVAADPTAPNVAGISHRKNLAIPPKTTPQPTAISIRMMKTTKRSTKRDQYISLSNFQLVTRLPIKKVTVITERKIIRYFMKLFILVSQKISKNCILRVLFVVRTASVGIIALFDLFVKLKIPLFSYKSLIIKRFIKIYPSFVLQIYLFQAVNN